MYEYIIGIFLVSFIALAVFLPSLNFAYAFAISEQQRQPHITASNNFQTQRIVPPSCISNSKRRTRGSKL